MPGGGADLEGALHGHLLLALAHWNTGEQELLDLQHSGTTLDKSRGAHRLDPGRLGVQHLWSPYWHEGGPF